MQKSMDHVDMDCRLLHISRYLSCDCATSWRPADPIWCSEDGHTLHNPCKHTPEIPLRKNVSIEICLFLCFFYVFFLKKKHLFISKI